MHVSDSVKHKCRNSLCNVSWTEIDILSLPYPSFSAPLLNLEDWCGLLLGGWDIKIFLPQELLLTDYLWILQFLNFYLESKDISIYILDNLGIMRAYKWQAQWLLIRCRRFSIPRFFFFSLNHFWAILKVSHYQCGFMKYFCCLLGTNVF